MRFFVYGYRIKLEDRSISDIHRLVSNSRIVRFPIFVTGGVDGLRVGTIGKLLQKALVISRSSLYCFSQVLSGIRHPFGAMLRRCICVHTLWRF